MLAGAGGCRATCDSPGRIVTDLRVDEAVSKLNRLSRGIVPGGVYVLENDAPSLVLDLGAQLARSEMRTWYSRNHQPGNYRYVVGSLSLASLCGPNNTVWPAGTEIRSVYEIPIVMSSSSSSVSRVLDPLFFLDVLNRSLTGAEYNRVAEQRIAGWRASLADVLFRARLRGTSQVTLCLAVETVQTGVVDLAQPVPLPIHADVIALLGRQSALEFSAVHRADAQGEAVQTSSQLAALMRPATISALFQEINLVNPSSEPRIEFALGYPRRIFVPMESY